MHITQVRNATLILEYASKRILIDPMLSAKDTYPPFVGTPNEHKRNPLVDLPFPIEKIVDVDAVIVTHLHRDHWDEAASASIPKSMPIYAQDERDSQKLRDEGFTDVRVLSDQSRLGSIELVRTSGQHGSDEAIKKLGDRLGHVCGVVFRYAAERTIYLAGDTVWNRSVVENLKAFTPDVIILNCGDARINAVGSIIMGANDVFEVAKAAPNATIIATHMEAVNHAVLTRAELKSFARDKGFISSLLVPDDGERIAL